MPEAQVFCRDWFTKELLVIVMSLEWISVVAYRFWFKDLVEQVLVDCFDDVGAKDVLEIKIIDEARFH